MCTFGWLVRPTAAFTVRLGTVQSMPSCRGGRTKCTSELGPATRHLHYGISNTAPESFVPCASMRAVLAHTGNRHHEHPFADQVM